LTLSAQSFILLGRRASVHERWKVKRLALLLSLAAATLVVTAPATANNKPTTGERINLFAPPTTFPANTPFYVEHGYICDRNDIGCIQTQISALSSFSLYVNGVLQPSTVDVDLAGGSIEKRYLTNFPAGLPAGTYTFDGVFDLNGFVSDLPATITFS
jgi:hypothetical protein